MRGRTRAENGRLRVAVQAGAGHKRAGRTPAMTAGMAIRR